MSHAYKLNEDVHHQPQGPQGPYGRRSTDDLHDRPTHADRIRRAS